ncbi:uncharacterized protein LOC133197443 [Saccostrea echinata]|uniref:uncharacterized protein LOC133197443 n=1 Tax=Saccostrea echinata TaxID=191078 RepID=UPI002A8178C3|nr:uncharacterized protein LOC133197443 [Saccostrea echinata]
MLPCFHTFCHHCLDGLIKSSCSGQISLGFTCPLCREFIAAPGSVGQWPPDKWTELFPLNKFIEYLTEKCLGLSTINCDACVEDGEDVVATNWCKDCRRSFCENCTKVHKKFSTVCDHETLSLGEITSATKPVDVVSKFCRVHKQNKSELFCRDHQVPSCALCVPMLHRTCDHIGSIQEQVINSDKTNIRARGLMKKMKAFCLLFENIIEEEKMNVAKIDEKTDLYTDMIRSVYERSIQYLKKLQETQLNQIAKMSKDSKAKLEATILGHENMKAYIQHSLKLISDTLEHGDDVDLLIQYSVVREKLKEIRKLDLKTVKIDLKATPIDRIENLKELLSLEMDEMSINIPETIDIAQSQLCVIDQFTVMNSDIRGGAFLSDGRLLLIDHKLHRCLIYTETGVLDKEAKFSSAPWEVYVYLDLLYITFPDTREVKMVRLDNLSEIKTFPVNCTCRGITKMENKVILAGKRIMETCNGDFEHLEETKVDANTDDLAADLNGNLIYSCYSKNTVTKKSNMNTTKFTYRHPCLRAAYGLAVDDTGNVYVCGYESNNIHIISADGNTLKILQGFKEPQCVKFKDNSVKFFVVEEKLKVIICELK